MTDTTNRPIRAIEETHASAVSWAAIVAGAFAAAAVSLILLALGSGWGLTALTPWSRPEATTFGVAAALWLIVMQWLSSALGGYVAGRLRTRWTGLHSDEVFFRDTVHGFLTWALATVVTAAVVLSAGSSVVGAGARAAAGAAGAAAHTAGAAGPDSYLIDILFRPSAPPAAGQAGARQPGEMRAESARILAEDVANGDVPPADRTYLAQLVAAQTGLSDADARKRVEDVVAQAKSAQATLLRSLDNTRKAASNFAFFTGFSLVIGAFVASAAGALGGHQRDEP